MKILQILLPSGLGGVERIASQLLISNQKDECYLGIDKNYYNDFISYFYLVMPAVSMAQGFGRIGCFCAGCCYGRETDAWYGITFTHSDFAPNGVSLIPTQLISSAGDFLICGVLLWYASKKPEPGRVAAGYLVLYGVGRFLIEFLRNDYRGSLGIFSTSQIISFGIVALGIALYFVIPKMMEKKE